MVNYGFWFFKETIIHCVTPSAGPDWSVIDAKVHRTPMNESLCHARGCPMETKLFSKSYLSQT